MTTCTFPPSYAPENHLCEDAPTHSGRGIHRETGRIYHPSCLFRPGPRQAPQPVRVESSLIHAVRRLRAAFSICGGQP